MRWFRLSRRSRDSRRRGPSSGISTGDGYSKQGSAEMSDRNDAAAAPVSQPEAVPPAAEDTAGDALEVTAEAPEKSAGAAPGSEAVADAEVGRQISRLSRRSLLWG